MAPDIPVVLVGWCIAQLLFNALLAALVAVLPDQVAAKDLGVFNIAGALPFSVAPGITPAILALGGGSYGVLYVVAIVGALAILPVKGVR